MKKIREVFFSPGGTVKQISKLFCNAAQWNDTNKIDLLNEKILEQQKFTSEDILVISMPVLAGRIPKVATEQIKKIKGENTPAIAMVVYGNRDYDDALIELVDVITENGFKIIGAGAFIARHSIFPQVAQNRPDEKDVKIIQSFAEQCLRKIEIEEPKIINVKGNRPYKEYSSSLPIHPKGDSNCIKCGHCAKICPTAAIDVNNPRKTNKKICISCTACIYQCPVHARKFSGILYNVASSKFEKKCSDYKVPELFI